MQTKMEAKVITKNKSRNLYTVIHAKSVESKFKIKKHTHAINTPLRNTTSHVKRKMKERKQTNQLIYRSTEPAIVCMYVCMLYVGMIILGMNMKNANTQFPSSDSNTVSSSVYRMICSPRPHQLPSCSIYSSKENAFKRKKGKLQGKARPDLC